MSALPFEKQIKHFFPFTKEMAKTSNGSGGFLDMTTSDFIANAANGDIRLFNEDGTTDTATGRFYFLRKTTSGKIVKSDLFDPARVKYYNLAAPRNKTGKTQVFTLSGVTANAVIVANLKLNYATSERNFATIFADVKVDATGDTPVKVLTKLAKALALTLASDIKTSTSISGDDVIISGTSVKKNKYFKITVAAGVLTIAEKDWILDGYVPGLKTHDQLMWNLELQTTSEAQAAQIVKTETAPIYAKGAG